ncbi:MAG: hypothetical protein ABI652_05645 [Acidobacteriota bacterium]
MAKRAVKTAPTELDHSAETIGTALGHVASRVDAWKQQRDELSSEIQKVLHSAQQLMIDLGHTSVVTKGAAALQQLVQRKGGRPKGGRPKGYQMSDATKAKLRAAWKRRKSAAGKAKPSA